MWTETEIEDMKKHIAYIEDLLELLIINHSNNRVVLNSKLNARLELENAQAEIVLDWANSDL